MEAPAGLMLVQTLNGTGSPDLNMGSLESATPSFLLIYMGISIVLPLFAFLVFNRLKGRGLKENQVVRLNCWFCCEDVSVKLEDKESWTCPCCDQYNGFTKDGDYIQPVEEQFDVKDYKMPTVCSPSEFVTTKSILCETCSQNQLLKVRQLATFTPFCEASHDDEVGLYSDYLESRYSLCELCRRQVSGYLELQDQRLAGTMKDEHLHLLDQLKKKGPEVRDCARVDEARLHQRNLPLLMFVVCLFAAVVHVILGSAHCPALLPLPGWLLVWAERASVYLGTVFCTVGLFIAGKNRLYPEDLGHLLLWLALIVSTSDLPTWASPWLDITRERMLFVDAATFLLSAICCWRKRVPRHWTAASIKKKQICQAETQLRDSQTVDTRFEETQHKTPCLPSTQQTHTEVDGTAQFDNVQQNLESLSLGLARRSGSTSSIWSLPAVVSTPICNSSPDSSTNDSVGIVRQPQRVLSPSRLGFLNLDSVLRECQSRSSSSESTFLSRGSSGSLHPHTTSSSTNPEVTPPLGLFSPLVQKPKQFLDATHQSLPSKNVYKSAFRSPTSLLHPPALFQDCGPCDSQTPDCLLQPLAAMNQLKSRHSDGGRTENTSSRTSLPRSKLRGHAAAAESGRVAPRRSQRTLVTGKLHKPWPLKKSLSCGNFWGHDVRPVMGPWRDADLSVLNLGHSVQQVRGPWRDADLSVPNLRFTQNASRKDPRNSVLKSHLAPVPEALVKLGAVNGASQTRSTNLPTSSTAAPEHAVPEFSDDECEDDTSLGGKASTGRHRTNDVSWPWLLVGAVMGASLACNVFLVCQGWSLAHTG